MARNKKVYKSFQIHHLALFLLILPVLVSACSMTPSPTEIQLDSTPTTSAETFTPPAGGERIIQFSGYEWIVRDGGFSGPGPNKWSGSNVWLDDDSNLHLKITHTNDGWYCAEVTTTQRFGFGEYQFQVIGQIDQLDPNIVLGLFNYPTAEVGADGTNEIDIEFAHWGNAEWPIGNFTVWPVQAGITQTSETFPVELNGTYTTHRFTWESQQIFFQSLHGHEDNNENEIASWLFKPDDPLNHISQQAMPVHINLWLFEGQTPVDGNEVEIIIRSFTFTPLGK
jgi:hypothetical protein